MVIRPDSGEPVNVIMNVLHMLDNKIGTTKNSKGYKVLPSYYRIIQGDGVNQESIDNILSFMKFEGFSASNIAFGMGGALLQQVNRDTQKFAYKCSAAKIDDEWVDVYKDPVTDPGKASKRGRLDLILNERGEYQTVSRQAVTSHRSQLETAYEPGYVRIGTLDAIRKRVNNSLK